jgi:hypothetical protein
MFKFGLNWKAIYEKKNIDGSVRWIVEIPFADEFNNFSCEFTIERSYSSQLNQSTIKIFNLSSETRALLRKDKYATTEFDKITFWAGYNNNLNLIFSGNVLQAESYDFSDTEIATEIIALDSSFIVYNTVSNYNLNAGVNYLTLLKKFTEDLSNKANSINETFVLNPLTPETENLLQNVKLKKATNIFGKTWEEMKLYFGDGLFIDNGTLNYLPVPLQNKNSVFLINAESGLLKAPKVSNAVIELQMVFEPTIQVGNVAEINTLKENFFNAKQFKIFGIKHNGNISQSVSSKVITTISLGRFDSNLYNLNL